MDAEATGIIAAVVTSLGETVATDAWNSFKTTLSRILGRNDRSETAREEEQLERDHDKIIAAKRAGDVDRIGRIDAKWSERLADFLEENPDQIGALRELVESNLGGKYQASAATQTVNTRNIAHGRSQIISGGFGDINVTLPRGE